MKKLRAATIGCGHFAKRLAAHLASLDQLQLVGFCDHTIENADAFNRQYAVGDTVVFTECEEMFEENNLDLVYICVPPYAHQKEVELAPFVSVRGCGSHHGDQWGYHESLGL